MTQKDILALAIKAGFTAAAPLNPDTIQLKQDVRQMCADGNCGMYGKRWSCPPGCGSLEECNENILGYPSGILVQTTGKIEDSFDFEGMQEIEAKHKQCFQVMHASLTKYFAHLLPLGAGCCTICKVCTYPEQPCRFPEKMVSSMEAYGMLVTEVCKSNNLPYYYGPNTMTYTSCFLYSEQT